MSHHDHKSKAPETVRVGLLTVSDTRTTDNDEGGRSLREMCERRGHVVVAQRIVCDEATPIVAAVSEFVASRAEAVLVTGGTGLAPRDITIEAIAPLFEKRIDGFGELFRALSFRAIGSSAMLSRAAAGVHRGVVVFVMPGSPAAVKLAMEDLVLPELAHAVSIARRG
ncbi:MAG: molybdenum cofactor biosynthesis protein MoaB [Deltaproteobacteria bacterium]|nr:molybdenum cofactor biosynthesis protein MoaB [Deltaproteobacteria bacterium]